MLFKYSYYSAIYFRPYFHRFSRNSRQSLNLVHFVTSLDSKYNSRIWKFCCACCRKICEKAWISSRKFDIQSQQKCRTLVHSKKKMPNVFFSMSKVIACTSNYKQHPCWIFLGFWASYSLPRTFSVVVGAHWIIIQPILIRDLPHLLLDTFRHIRHWPVAHDICFT